MNPNKAVTRFAYPPEIQSLFEPQAKFDATKVGVLDQVSTYMQSGDNQKMMMANQVWTDLKELTEFWINGDVVLEQSSNYQTKLLTLVLMEDTIKVLSSIIFLSYYSHTHKPQRFHVFFNNPLTNYICLNEKQQQKWLAMPEQARESLKNYMVNYVFKQSGQANLSHQDTTILNKCNSVLIKIFKFEWNTTWSNFIPDICVSSRSDQNVCENSLRLLKVLSEEIFDFSKNEMTSSQIQLLKKTMSEQFKHIYELCFFIASSSISNLGACKQSLIRACLETFEVYLSWIPIVYIFDTNLIEILLFFVGETEFRTIAIQCLTKIALLKIEIELSEEDRNKVRSKFCDLFFKFLAKVTESIIPDNIHIASERKRLRQARQHTQVDKFDDICKHIAFFLTSFLQTHLIWVEKIANSGDQISSQLQQAIARGLSYIVNINEIDDENIFKICIDFWHFLTTKQIKSIQNLIQSQNAAITNSTTSAASSSSFFNALSMNFSQSTGNANQIDERQHLRFTVYPQIFSQTRSLLCMRMAKPQEVLIVIEDGVPVRQNLTDTENNSLYDLLKEILINLARLDWQDMKYILTNKLKNQINGTEWSYDNLNSICWAIGSISGTGAPQEEKQIIMEYIMGLTQLVQMKNDKESRAVVSSGIMYVLSAYPSFLKDNWMLLSVLVSKLFEFMAESFPGVSEMAVNSFLVISSTCADEFVKVQFDQSKELQPFLVSLLQGKFEEVASRLDPQHRLTFYESIGHMIRAEPDSQKCASYLEAILQTHLQNWKQIIAAAQQNPSILDQDNIVQTISTFLKINERLCSSAGYNFVFIIGQINIGMNEIFKYYSQSINNAVKQYGKHQLNLTVYKRLRVIRKDIIKLYISFFKFCKQGTPFFNANTIASSIIEPIQQALLVDYVNSLEECREAELLGLYSVVFENMSANITAMIPDTLNGIFLSTLPMITLDFTSYPDHRIAFFRFLKVIVQNTIEALFNIPSDAFKTMIHCVMWASKHHATEISDIGLDVLFFILRQVNTSQNVANQFYAIYYLNLLKDVLEVLTDGYHRNGFKQQCTILQILVSIVKTSFISCHVFENQTSDNATSVFEFVVQALAAAYPNISLQQTQTHIQNLFEKSEQPQQFKVELRDYLINLSTYQNDNDHLYETHEQEQQINQLSLNQS